MDSDPVIIANVLEKNSKMKKILKQYPGIRLPSGWNPFEIAIATILGQLVSIERGRTLVSDLIEIAGTPVHDLKIDRKITLFPTPKQIMNADLSSLKTTQMRKKTLIAFATAVDNGDICLEATQHVDLFFKKVLAIKGIGPWSAQYMALKILRDTDSFPGSDLILARALELHSKEVIDSMAPWRGYVASLLWRTYAATLTKKK